MDHIGIDVHKVHSQICMITSDGELIERRIRTERGRFAEVLGKRRRARILIEASTESEWAARCLEALGHDVVVADPNYAPMYATRSRKVKTDRRDARTLAEACEIGAYRRAHRTSDAARHLRAELGARQALVETRTRYIAQISAAVRREGLRVRTGAAAGFADRVEEVALPETVRGEIAPLIEVMGLLNTQIATLDEALAKLTEDDPVIARLTSMPGVGPVIAATFQATLDETDRFSSAQQVAAYLGLVPREHSSGEKRHRGSITKAGNRRLRSLLVEAAWTVMRSKQASVRELQRWAEAVALRRGKRVAAVALARRLARILFALWRDGGTFDPARIRSHGAQEPAVAKAS